ncbi:TetR/AcrR family transcriptional regulator [Paenibacillus motobuensis]|uniref:TetR/AcrR family transcriptional regulator n=1 Tax=Paenibacillus TaxID=44249 RepID=UPI002040068E|nr:MULTISPECIES: TetR/AcrR family transcriptional regulator [Paenibacillus]MCM3041593.1 TetR/AcrR family transcriptional regulator [Paenibacillus lutimineralis]MCM3648697.1 TetR/AcrR family transcriptional regulator [Paenibacillus motobuensis]
MDPKTRHRNELQRGKQNRIQLVIEAAEEVFKERGIDQTTMQNIADRACVGVATVFRFFPKKEKLVVAVATRNLEIVLQTFQAIAEMPVSCYEKISLLFDDFITLLDSDDSSNVKLLENFESYAAYYKEPIEDIDIFNKIYRQISDVFSAIIQQGMEDGSIRTDIPVDKVLTTVINSFGNFARKLSLQKNILTVEPDLDPKEQLLILKDILLSYLKG